jgi:hypothetical protein
MANRMLTITPVLPSGRLSPFPSLAFGGKSWSNMQCSMACGPHSIPTICEQSIPLRKTHIYLPIIGFKRLRAASPGVALAKAASSRAWVTGSACLATSIGYLCRKYGTTVREAIVKAIPRQCAGVAKLGTRTFLRLQSVRHPCLCDVATTPR